MRHAFPLLFTCALVAGGCLAPEQRAPVDSPVLVRVRENLAPEGRTLRLDCATEREYGCSNFQVRFRQERYGTTIAIAFTGIAMPTICLTSLGPATAAIPLGRMPEGSYPLRFSANGTTVAGALDVTRDSIAVRGGEGRWTRIPRPVLQRVPPGTIWGLIGWGPSDQSARDRSFLDSLKATGARDRSFTPGDYDYFRVDANGTIELPLMHGYYRARAYALRYDGDPAKLPGVVRAWGDSLWISLYDDRGGQIYSWMLRGGT